MDTRSESAESSLDEMRTSPVEPSTGALAVLSHVPDSQTEEVLKSLAPRIDPECVISMEVCAELGVLIERLRASDATESQAPHAGWSGLEDCPEMLEALRHHDSGYSLLLAAVMERASVRQAALDADQGMNDARTGEARNAAGSATCSGSSV